MTSANTCNYIITDLEGKEVGHHHFNFYCKPRWEQLLKFNPPENFLIYSYWDDEEEEQHWTEPISLKVFLIKNKVIIP